MWVFCLRFYNSHLVMGLTVLIGGVQFVVDELGNIVLALL